VVESNASPKEVVVAPRSDCVVSGGSPQLVSARATREHVVPLIADEQIVSDAAPCFFDRDQGVGNTWLRTAGPERPSSLREIHCDANRVTDAEAVSNHI
jgi:hypothetical protein